MSDKFAVAIVGAGSQQVVPPPASAGFSKAFIRVLSYHLSASATSTVTHQSSVSSAVLSTDYLGTSSPVSELDDDGGVYDVPPGEGLVIASTGGNVGGCGRYVVMPGVRINPNLPPVLGPISSAAPVISGSLAQGQTLSVTNGTWLNTPISYAYQWYSASTPVGTSISTYVTQLTDVGKNITCTVTATNASGSGQATALPVGPITTAPPHSMLWPDSSPLLWPDTTPMMWPS